MLLPLLIINTLRTNPLGITPSDSTAVFYAATGAALYVLRRRLPDAPRPYRTWGYPWVPAIFILATAFLVVNTQRERPAQALWGMGLLALGLPANWMWRRKKSVVLGR